MKYILHELGELPNEGRLVVCETEEQRDRATLAAIFGDPNAAEPEHAEKYLAALRSEGRISFEGDPGLEWINVLEVVAPNGPAQPRDQ